MQGVGGAGGEYIPEQQAEPRADRVAGSRLCRVRTLQRALGIGGVYVLPVTREGLSP